MAESRDEEWEELEEQLQEEPLFSTPLDKEDPYITFTRVFTRTPRPVFKSDVRTGKGKSCSDKCHYEFPVTGRSETALCHRATSKNQPRQRTRRAQPQRQLTDGNVVFYSIAWHLDGKVMI